MAPEEVRFLLVHHTASSNKYQPDGVASILLGAYRFHVSAEKGFADICYNFLIDRFGRVWEGRAGSIDGPVTADATGGSQGFAQLVCLIGDFTSELPTPEALDALTRILAWMADRFGVDTTPGATVEFVSRGSNRWSAGENVVAATVSGHRDMSATACPGDLFYPMVHDDIQQIVTTFRSTNVAAAPLPTPVPVTVPVTLAPTTVAPTAPPSTAPTMEPAPTTSSVMSSTPASATTSAATTAAASASTTGMVSPSTLPPAPLSAVGTTMPTPGGSGGSGGSGGDGSVIGWAAGAVGVIAVAAAVTVLRRGHAEPDPVDPPDSSQP
ncbi:MAG: N-acetylmuramoyl-L-alanine amidase [Ilumatobacteraceae bacterium]